MSETKYSNEHGTTLVKTTGGQDWVGFKTIDDSFHGTMTLHKWEGLDKEALTTGEVVLELEDSEWPYDQE
jgi:hypothetical protein